MKKSAKYSAIALVITAVGVGAVNASGWGERCERFERGDHGPRHSMMTKGGRFADRQLDLSADQVRTLIEAKLILRGNDNIRVGDITEIDAKTYRVQIVTKEGSLVREFEVDKDKGPRRMGRPF